MANGEPPIGIPWETFQKFAKVTYSFMKGVIYMTIVKRILSGLVIFIAGLEVGGFGIWYLTMKAINESSSRRTSRNYASYKDYH